MISAAFCKFEDLSTINPPGFLQPSIKAGDVIAAGQHVSYTCAEDYKMLPFVVDPDSNFALEVYCVDGKFLMPNWPAECEDEIVCDSSVYLPEPPATADIKLVRADNRTKYRSGEQVYFVCEDPTAVIDDGSGSNMFGVTCPIGLVDAADQLNFPQNVVWPKCIIEPTCQQLPVPSAESLLEKTTVDNSVKIGEYIEYGCISRADFFETPQVRKFKTCKKAKN